MTAKSDRDQVRLVRALEYLSDWMGEIHAGRMIGTLAEDHPELFQTKHTNYVIRVAEGAIAMALRKFDDLWKAQIAEELLADNPPSEGVELSAEFNDRGLREFANRMVAHYASEKTEPGLSETERAELLSRSGFETSGEFFQWTCEAIEKIGAVEERLRASLEV